MIDFERIAKILVERQLRIRPGEVVRVTGGPHNLAFVEEIVLAVRKQGAFPMVEITWASVARRLTNEIPDALLRRAAPHLPEIEKIVDCSISVAPIDDPALLAGLDPEKSRLRAEAGMAAREASVAKGARRIGIGFPTPAQARIYAVAFDDYHELFWTAAQADVDRIAETCHLLQRRLGGRRDVEIVAPNGSRLGFSIAERRINMDDGVISDEDLETGDITANLPFGEVYLAPIEESVQGDATFPVVFHGGTRIEELTLHFDEGRLTRSSAGANHGVFLDAMSKHTGDNDRLGEFGIGTNHEVHVPIGDNLLDEKTYGSIHLALGENRSYGGSNSSSLHWDMIMLRPTVSIDGELLIDEGRFRL